MDSHQSRLRFHLHNLPPIIPNPCLVSHNVPPSPGGPLYQARFSQHRFPSNHGRYFPPPPPLLKLGQQGTNIPSVSQGPSISLSHQTPIQAHYSQVRSGPSISLSQQTSNQALYSHVRSGPTLSLSQQTSNQALYSKVRSGPSISLSQQTWQQGHYSPLTSHLIGLLQQPPVSSLSSPPSPGPLPLTIKDALSPSYSTSSSSSTLDDKDRPVVSEESDFSSNTELSNAAKCKEYRERNKLKRRKEEQEYLKEYEKHKKLKAKYYRQKKSIERLKDYYLQLLKKGELNCPKTKNSEPNEENEENNKESKSQDIEPPLVTIKTEIELNVNDIIVKTEENEV